MKEFTVESPFTFEEAFEKFQLYSEQFGHIGIVELRYSNGRIILTHFELC